MLSAQAELLLGHRDVVHVKGESQDTVDQDDTWISTEDVTRTLDENREDGN